MTKQTINQKHPMYGYLEAQRKLKSRRSFITNSNATRNPPDQPSVGKWRKELRDEMPVRPVERLLLDAEISLYGSQ